MQSSLLDTLEQPHLHRLQLPHLYHGALYLHLFFLEPVQVRPPLLLHLFLPNLFIPCLYPRDRALVKGAVVAFAGSGAMEWISFVGLLYDARCIGVALGDSESILRILHLLYNHLPLLLLLLKLLQLILLLRPIHHLTLHPRPKDPLLALLELHPLHSQLLRLDELALLSLLLLDFGLFS